MKLLFAIAVAMMLFSCSENEPVIIPEEIQQLVCNTENSEFDQIFSAIVSDPDTWDMVSMDLKMHINEFVLSEARTLCSIGYKNEIQDDPDMPYIIEIQEVDSGIVVFSEELYFSTNATSYSELPTPLELEANVEYLIKRIETSDNLQNYLGRMAWNQFDDFLPRTNGQLTVLSSGRLNSADEYSRFYDTLFYIDLVFAQ